MLQDKRERKELPPSPVELREGAAELEGELGALFEGAREDRAAGARPQSHVARREHGERKSQLGGLESRGEREGGKVRE